MAQQFLFVCDTCTFSIENWDDGNPYQLSKDDKRIYINHPEDLSISIGNAPDYICRDCYKISRINCDIDKLHCSSCNSKEIEKVSNLNNKTCIKCHGIFVKYITGAIS